VCSFQAFNNIGAEPTVNVDDDRLLIVSDDLLLGFGVVLPGDVLVAVESRQRSRKADRGEALKEGGQQRGRVVRAGVVGTRTQALVPVTAQEGKTPKCKYPHEALGLKLLYVGHREVPRHLRKVIRCGDQQGGNCPTLLVFNFGEFRLEERVFTLYRSAHFGRSGSTSHALAAWSRHRAQVRNRKRAFPKAPIALLFRVVARGF
jgi:hypothetical protein